MPNGRLIAPRGRLREFVGEEGILSDLLDILGLDQPDPSDLISPLGMATMPVRKIGQGLFRRTSPTERMLEKRGARFLEDLTKIPEQFLRGENMRTPDFSKIPFDERQRLSKLTEDLIGVDAAMQHLERVIGVPMISPRTVERFRKSMSKLPERISKEGLNLVDLSPQALRGIVEEAGLSAGKKERLTKAFEFLPRFEELRNFFMVNVDDLGRPSFEPIEELAEEEAQELFRSIVGGELDNITELLPELIELSRRGSQ